MTIRAQPCAAALTLAVAAAVAACGGGGAAAGPVREAAAPSPRLYLAGDGELWVIDVRTERARRVPLRRLSPGDPPHRIVRRGRRLVLWGATTYVADPGFRRPPQLLLRRSWFFIPSAHPDRVWIAFLDRRSPPTVRGLRAVQEMTAGGRVTVHPVRPPGGRWPQRALASGLLLPAGGTDDAYILWDPAARTVVRRLPRRAVGELGPADGDVLASCPARCGTFRLTDVRTGVQRDVPAPDGFRYEAGNAAFSPDGRRLAVPVRRRGAGQHARRHLALVDVASRTARVIPGSRVPPGYTMTAWSASGRYAFITGGERMRARTITAYRLGTPRARVLQVAVGDFYDIAAR